MFLASVVREFILGYFMFELIFCRLGMYKLNFHGYF